MKICFLVFDISFFLLCNRMLPGFKGLFLFLRIRRLERNTDGKYEKKQAYDSLFIDSFSFNYIWL